MPTLSDNDMRYRELTIELPEIAMDAVTSRLMDLGCLGTVENAGSITAYFEEPADVAMIARELGQVRTALALSGIDASLSLSSTVIEGQDWNRSWKSGFRPTDIGERFTILPPWEEPTPGRINIIIDPGMAFGTGHHETTRSCIVLLEKYAERTRRSRFLDLGTGTGLLALAAVHLGFEHVVALDTDVLAIEATKRNIASNQAQSIDVLHGDISLADGTFDIIAANLISGTLVALAAPLASRLQPGALSILSGILIGQESEVLDAMMSEGYRLLENLKDGKWISLVMVRT